MACRGAAGPRGLFPVSRSTTTSIVPDLDSGASFAGYRIEGIAGRGGMGVIYRATDTSLDRTVALKLIAPELALSPGFRRRFTSESKIAASLDHPNVIPIFAAGEHEGELFLVQRFVEGNDLRHEIEAEGPMSVDQVTQILAQAASALDAAHAAGLVHRDVKPANMLITTSGHLYLMDFGLSKRLLKDADETQTGRFFGTLNYVSPEQIRGGDVDHRADIYGLGCVLFHLLTGHVPFPVDGQEAKLWAHVSEPPPLVSSVRSDVPTGMDAIIARAMAKQPSERFDSAGELATAFAEAATSARSVGASSTSSRSAPRSNASDRWRRALIVNALISPFSLLILAATLIVGVVAGLMPQILPIALAIYAGAVGLIYRDQDVQRKVLERRGLSAPQLAAKTEGE
jgi:serine/threonine protein kinase